MIRARLLGTLVPVVVCVMVNGMTMLNAPCYAQTFVQGALLAGALVVSCTLTPGRRERTVR